MGMYLNPKKPVRLYKSEYDRRYFVDKSLLLEELFPMVEEGNRFVCITRPRRFGKTVMANMIAAFFGKGKECRDMFDNLAIANTEGYEEHINKHNLIFISLNELPDKCTTYAQYIERIKVTLRRDLRHSYPDCEIEEDEAVWDILNLIYEQYETQFIFVLDEWDFIFHRSFVTEKDKAEYILFLSNLLKDKPYVSLAYMTGILPIAKYSSGSELNMFAEYTMASKEKFGDYFGFTETEADMLYERYLKNNSEPRITREGLRQWYDGYLSFGGERLYNPRSVVLALSDNQLADYWTSSGPYDEIFYYVKHNVADVRDDIALMIAGETVTANVKEYAATATELKNRDQILSAMIVYGFLTCENNKVSIPNKELMDKFAEMVQTEKSLGYIYRLARESDRMLKATLVCDTKTMEKILKQAHDTETSMTGYNNETELSSVVKLVYLAARDMYDVQREDKSGVGYVDFIFYPVIDRTADCIILELKVGHTADEAIQQIKDRNYIQRFLGKIGEKPKYTGRILAVGISYRNDSTNKKHECRVEVLREKIEV